jgi:integrase
MTANLTPKQGVERFVRALAAQPALWRDYFLLLRLTKQRRSAPAALCWDEVSLEAGMITLRPDAQSAKGKGWHSCALSPSA